MKVFIISGTAAGMFQFCGSPWATHQHVRHWSGLYRRLATTEDEHGECTTWRWSPGALPVQGRCVLRAFSERIHVLQRWHGALNCHSQSRLCAGAPLGVVGGHCKRLVGLLQNFDAHLYQAVCWWCDLFSFVSVVLLLVQNQASRVCKTCAVCCSVCFSLGTPWFPTDTGSAQVRAPDIFGFAQRCRHRSVWESYITVMSAERTRDIKQGSEGHVTVQTWKGWYRHWLATVLRHLWVHSDTNP